MTEEESKSFEIFGKMFQTRVLQATLTDYKFFQNIYEILKPEYFSSDVHRNLWITIRTFFEKYKSAPSTESLRVEYASVEGDEKESVIKILWDIEHKISLHEIEQAKEKAFKFCRNKSMEAAIIDSVDLLKNNEFDKIQCRIEKALKDSVQIDIGHEYFESLGIRAAKNMRNPISTGFAVLDETNVMDGGLAGGELGIIMAPTGGGKSFFLVNIGAGALKAGIDVVHYTFELSEYNVGLRYDSCITGVPTKEIPNKIPEVEGLLKSFKGGKLIIKEFPTKTATVNNIRFHWEHLRACGYNPKLIITDYADLMRSRRGYDQKRFELESIYEDLRGLSMDIKIPIWSASQSNRAGASSEIIDLEHIGEAYSKAQIADFIATYSSNMSEKRRGIGKFFIAKNRIGEDGYWLPVSVDFSRAKIAISKRIEEDDNDDVIMKDSEESTNSIIKKLFEDSKAKRL